MVTESGLNLKRIIAFLKRSRSADWERVEVEGDKEVWRRDDPLAALDYRHVDLWGVDSIGASEFLSFAKQDLEEDSERGRVNALSNAKRAIECRMDEFLALSYLRGFSLREGWKLPYKMQVLQTFGVPAPNVLRNLITSKRNLLEHEYRRPADRQEVRNIVDVAELFLEASRRYVEKGYIASAVLSHTSWFKASENYGLREEYEVGFNLESEELTLKYLSKELWWKHSKTGHPAVDSEVLIEEEGPVTLRIRECMMEDVRELVMLLGKE